MTLAKAPWKIAWAWPTHQTGLMKPKRGSKSRPKEEMEQAVATSACIFEPGHAPCCLLSLSLSPSRRRRRLRRRGGGGDGPPAAAGRAGGRVGAFRLPHHLRVLPRRQPLRSHGIVTSPPNPNPLWLILFLRVAVGGLALRPRDL